MYQGGKHRMTRPTQAPSHAGWETRFPGQRIITCTILPSKRHLSLVGAGPRQILRDAQPSFPPPSACSFSRMCFLSRQPRPVCPGEGNRLMPLECDPDVTSQRGPHFIVTLRDEKGSPTFVVRCIVHICRPICDRHGLSSRAPQRAPLVITNQMSTMFFFPVDSFQRTERAAPVLAPSSTSFWKAIRCHPMAGGALKQSNVLA